MVDQKSRYLITSSDERTWKFDRPVIFLGEWCCLYNRRHIWQKMDAIVAKPYGVSKSLKASDLLKSKELESNLFLMLYSSLNSHHGLNYSERFWKILLGIWLRRFVRMMINRIHTIQQCINEYQISGTSVFSNDGITLTPSNTATSIWDFNNSQFNNILTGRILNLLEIKGIPIEIIENNKDNKDKSSINQNGLIKILIKWMLKFFGRLLALFMRENDALIINSYLPFKDEVKLHIALKQLPQFWGTTIYTVTANPNDVLRNNLKRLSINKKIMSQDIKVISTILFELLPICFLEDFSALNKLAHKQHWPKKPKFIFTSNNYDSDEVFKLWTALKVESGYKYFVGQHGNNNGTMEERIGAIEEVTSDKYLTWGWKDELSQHTPAFIFKNTEIRLENYNPKGGLLLIELHLEHRSNTWDNTFQFGNYFKEQKDFVSRLGSDPKKNLTIRLHPSCQQFNWEDESRWHDFDQNLKIDNTNNNIRSLIAQNRLIIHSYDSTGILETLSNNIPTLAFWQEGFQHLRKSAIPYYQCLVEAEIIHFTPESIANKVNEVWDDVDGWWDKPYVQNSRLKFCNRYARNSSNPIQELKSILLK